MSISDPARIEDLRAETQARALGFGRAVDLFPADVHAAARRAAAFRIQLDPPSDPTREPWPPMHRPPLDERRAITATS